MQHKVADKLEFLTREFHQTVCAHQIYTIILSLSLATTVHEIAHKLSTHMRDAIENMEKSSSHFTLAQKQITYEQELRQCRLLLSFTSRAKSSKN